MKKILVLYFQIGRKKDRNHVNEHLYSFRHYVDQAEFYYFNAYNGIPRFLTVPKFDGVIIHYTFLIRRWNRKYYDDWSKKIQHLKTIKGYKIGISQDEYAEADKLCSILNEFGVRAIFTCLSKEDYKKIFPIDKIKLDNIETVLAGYIDDRAATGLKKKCIDRKNRKVDLGYRSQKHPYWLGYHGQLKYEISKIFKEKLNKRDIITDISINDRDIIHGDKWYEFLLNCRVILGCEGGASLLDPTGKIRSAVERFTRKNPQASFREVESACFPGIDYSLNLFTISPRHFESIITKTCQVLLEGEYNGVLKPDIHYIELKKDYSNFDSVIKRIKNKSYCKKIAQQAYEDIYESDLYSYKTFANHITDYISQKTGHINLRFTDRMVFLLLKVHLGMQKLFEPILIKLFFPWRYLKIYKLDIFRQIWIKKSRKGEQ